MLEELKKRRDNAAKKNCYVLFEALKKSTQEWTTKLTGIQHWQPEHGYDVFVFDPDNKGATYILLRRWNEEQQKFDEKIQKHDTGDSDLPVAVSKTKEWVFDNWETLKAFKGDTPDTKEETVAPEVKSAEEEPEEKEIENSLEEATEEAFEDSTAEQDAKFENFMDNGVQTDEEREEIWKHPWIRRIATQLNEMGKDHSQFERTLQNSKERREKALEKSLHTLTGKIQTLTEKTSIRLQKETKNV
jgi:hypothetical protein